MIIPLRYIWKPVTNENDDENAEKDPQEVAENVHEHDRRQSHLKEKKYQKYILVNYI